MSIVGLDGSVTSVVPKITGVRPVGTQVHVELLTAKEVMGTNLSISDDSETGGAPQGYIIALGPRVASEWGYEPGDRVILSGAFTPMPEIPGTHRIHAMVEPQTIKGVLVEDK